LVNGRTIFVAPKGIDPTNGWADTAGPGDAHDGPVNTASTGGQDIAFTEALVAQPESRLCIDTTRVFAERFSAHALPRSGSVGQSPTTPTRMLARTTIGGTTGL